MSEEHEADIRREAIADERAKTLRFLRNMTHPDWWAAARAIEDGAHLKSGGRSLMPNAEPICGRAPWGLVKRCV